MDTRNKPLRQPNCEAEEFRCLCGSLMAKITPLGVEVKCRKCKRLHIIPNSQISYEVPRGSDKLNHWPGSTPVAEGRL